MSFFDWVAWPYDALTRPKRWREHCRALAHDLESGPSGRPLLDVGTGPGVSAIELARGAPSRFVVGIDLSAPMLARARAHVGAAGLPDRVALVRAEAQALPFRDGVFGGATAHSVLYLVPSADAVAREVARTLAEGGRFVDVEPRTGFRPPPLRLLRDPVSFIATILWRIVSAWYGRIPLERLERILRGAGFEPLESGPTLDGVAVRVVAERPRRDR